MSPLALELIGIRKDFGRTQIIRGVDLAVPRGERHAIIGPNGAGKSTLFNLISGRLRRARASSASTARTSPARGRRRSTGAALRAAFRSPTSFRA